MKKINKEELKSVIKEMLEAEEQQSITVNVAPVPEEKKLDDE